MRLTRFIPFTALLAACVHTEPCGYSRGAAECGPPLPKTCTCDGVIRPYVATGIALAAPGYCGGLITVCEGHVLPPPDAGIR